MFKFMKSKKGFTLVELMIVVVIMAILVAVAVPIFSAVTKNARTKTCLANQREIQAQFNNAEMSDIITLNVDDEFVLKTNDDGDGGEWTTTPNGISSATLEDLFQKVPYCPVAGNSIEVTISAVTIDAEESGFKVDTVCVAADDEAHND